MVHVTRQVVREGRHAYVLVNNRAEGDAVPLRKPSPLTVQGLVEMLRG